MTSLNLDHSFIQGLSQGNEVDHFFQTKVEPVFVRKKLFCETMSPESSNMHEVTSGLHLDVDMRLEVEHVCGSQPVCGLVLDIIPGEGAELLSANLEHCVEQCVSVSHDLGHHPLVQHLSNAAHAFFTCVLLLEADLIISEPSAGKNKQNAIRLKSFR